MDLPIKITLSLAVGISIVMVLGFMLNSQASSATNFFTGVMP